MKTIAVLTVVACSLFVGVGAQDVVFYEHAGYGGKSWTAPKQAYFTIPDGWWWNDEMSSIKINSLHVKYIYLYEDRWFKGDKLKVTNSTDYIGWVKSGWNDKMSSFMIIFHPPPPACVRAFRYPRFQGGYELFCGDRSFLNNATAPWNDAFQSLVIAPDYVATFYEHAHYRGRSTQVAGASWYLSEHLVYSPVGTEISSLRIASAHPTSGCLRVFQLENFTGLTRKFCKYVEGDNLWLGSQKWPWPDASSSTWRWKAMSAIVGPRCSIDLKYSGYIYGDLWTYRVGASMYNHTLSYRVLPLTIHTIKYNDGDCGA